MPQCFLCTLGLVSDWFGSPQVLSTPARKKQFRNRELAMRIIQSLMQLQAISLLFKSSEIALRYTISHFFRFNRSFTWKT